MNKPSNERQHFVHGIASMISNAAVVALKVLVRCYQVVISPFVQPRCRFHPSCSHYAMDALETRGLVTGSVLAIKRLARCHPWSEGGLDLVPKPKADKSIE